MSTHPQRAPSARTYALLFALGLALMGAFVALGAWQLTRRSWKVELIARTEARTNAAPLPAPGPGTWPRMDARGFEYRRVRATGRFRRERETLVQAATARGAGWWVMTPLLTDDGWTLLVNRGFVPDDRRDPATRLEAGGRVGVTGLLRWSEPGGGWPRRNDPAADRWYARDIPAIAARRGLASVAPYFVDADATANPGGVPVGGLTEVRFRNHHAVYALTWFALAALVAGALALLERDWRRRGRATMHWKGSSDRVGSGP